MVNLRFLFGKVREIHVEAIASDVVYAKLVNYVLKKPVMCLVTALNESWCDQRIAIDSMPQNKYEELLKERYSNLAKHVKIGLHTHLHHKYTVRKLSFAEQYQKICEGTEFLENLGLKIVDFAPGWWSYDENTIRVCELLSFERFHYTQKMVDVVSSLEFVKIHRWLHDFDL